MSEVKLKLRNSAAIAFEALLSGLDVTIGEYTYTLHRTKVFVPELCIVATEVSKPCLLGEDERYLIRTGMNIGNFVEIAEAMSEEDRMQLVFSSVMTKIQSK